MWLTHWLTNILPIPDFISVWQMSQKKCIIQKWQRLTYFIDNTCPIAHVSYTSQISVLKWTCQSCQRKQPIVKIDRIRGNRAAPFLCLYVCVCATWSECMYTCVRVCMTSDVSSCGGSLQTKFTMALVEVNVGPPICCFRIIPCYLWKRRVEEYGRSVQQPSFSIYPFRSPGHFAIICEISCSSRRRVCTKCTSWSVYFMPRGEEKAAAAEENKWERER